MPAAGSLTLLPTTRRLIGSRNHGQIRNRTSGAPGRGPALPDRAGPLCRRHRSAGHGSRRQRAVAARPFQPLLVSDRVRHVGDRIAFVVAETLEQARDAAELVEVDYEPLPAVVNIEDAAKPDALKVWDDNPAGNNAFRLMFGDQAATDAAFAKAKHVVKLRVENNRLSPVSMEPRVAIGDYDRANDFYTLYAASQNPHGLRQELSHIFHVPENQIRCISPDVGGGFGLNGGAFADDLLVMWAARKLRRPVKWVAT